MVCSRMTIHVGHVCRNERQLPVRVRVRVEGSGPTKGMPVLSAARQGDEAAGWAMSQRDRQCARSTNHKTPN
eukprot:364938-Chlamydomonas_euryale.AAC.6